MNNYEDSQDYYAKGIRSRPSSFKDLMNGRPGFQVQENLEFERILAARDEMLEFSVFTRKAMRDCATSGILH